MASIEYHASTLAEIKAHASEDNVVIYIDNDIDAGSAEWETISIGSVSELHFQGHRLLRPYIKANNYLFSGGTVREAKILNVFEQGSSYMFNRVNLIDCAVSLRSVNTTSAIFNECIFTRCNVNIEFPNLMNAYVFSLHTGTERNRYPKDSLFTINGEVKKDIFYSPTTDGSRVFAEGCRFDGKLTGTMEGFCYNLYPRTINDCIINIDITECNITKSHASNGYVWYNSDIFNRGSFPRNWKAVTSEQLTDPEYMKSVGLNVEILG